MTADPAAVVAALSYRQRRLLVALDDHVHFAAKKGFRRNSAGAALVLNATVNPLWSRGLLALEAVAGKRALTLTPAGKAAAEAIRAGSARLPGRQPAPAGDAPSYWWTDR